MNECINAVAVNAMQFCCFAQNLQPCECCRNYWSLGNNDDAGKFNSVVMHHIVTFPLAGYKDSVQWHRSRHETERISVPSPIISTSDAQPYPSSFSYPLPNGQSSLIAVRASQVGLGWKARKHCSTSAVINVYVSCKYVSRRRSIVRRL